MSCVLESRGKFVGHRDWVTCLASSFEAANMVISGSRDKRVIIWELTGVSDEVEGSGPGYARRSLGGHSQAVSDVVVSSDGQFALSASWDCTMRLWDLASGQTVRVFKGHTKDVNSVAFSSDNRQIVSGSRDRTLRLWNTLAECKFTISEGAHTDWISCVRFSPSAKSPMIVSASWDKLVKVWNLGDCKLKSNLEGHTGPIYTVTISPDGSLCASGGKDKTAMLWDVMDGKHLYSLECTSPINAMSFSPKNYWLVAATDKSIIVWDLENKQVLDEMIPTPEEAPKNGYPFAVSVCWSADGNALFVGCTNGEILVYSVQDL